jgi:hypothetical protein
MHTPLSLSLAAAALAAGSLAAAQPVHAPTAAAVPAASAIAPVTASVSDGQRLDAGPQALSFSLARALHPAQGQLTLLVNGNDVGAFLRSDDARVWRLSEADFPLPAGPLRLELVLEPPGDAEPVLLWSAEITRAGGEAPGSLGPATPEASELAGASGEGGGQVGSEPARGGFSPRLAATASTSSTRQTIDGVDAGTVLTHELGVQLGLRQSLEQDDLRVSMAANFLGNSQRAKAVRFGQAGGEADKFDLNDYLLEFQTASARLSLGHATVAGNPLLGAAFSNRGISGGYRWANGVDLALTSQYSTAVLGGRALLGFNEATRRVNAMTVGFELLPDQPGVLRVEATGMAGELTQAPAAPGVGADTNRERSHGFGLRALWNPVNSIYRAEAAFATSTSVQPDAFGNEQIAHGRKAYFLDGTARLVGEAGGGGAGGPALSLRLRHEYADSGFRSIAGGSAGDFRRTLVGLDGQWAGVRAQWSHTLGENNVQRDPVLPVARTTADSVNLTWPLASLFSPPAPDGPPPATPGSWWPVLQLAWQHGTQRPSSVPAFMPLALIPAAATTNSTLGAQWARGDWSWSLGLTRGFQDNQQPGSDQQDLRSRGVQAQLQWQAMAGLSLSAGARRSRSTQTDTQLTQYQNGADFGVNWASPGNGWTLSALASLNGSHDSLASNEARGRTWQLQAGKTFMVPMGLRQPVAWQLALRLQRQTDRNSSNFFGMTSLNEQHTTVSMLTLSATF